MIILQNNAQYIIGIQQPAVLSEEARRKLLSLANEDTEDELLDMLSEAESIAKPAVLFGVLPVTRSGDNTVKVGETALDSPLLVKRLGEVGRCFPYIATCGREMDDWSKQYRYDPLAEFWAEEIKKAFLRCLLGEFLPHIKQHYRTGGYLAALNPGSLKEWPISGQAQLFSILGGRDFVQASIGVTYNDSYLMEPTKSVSGIAFESGSFYENCQYCPLDNCPNRRAKRITEE